MDPSSSVAALPNPNALSVVPTPGAPGPRTSAALWVGDLAKEVTDQT
jgi:hypothetical protein